MTKLCRWNDGSPIVIPNSRKLVDPVEGGPDKVTFNAKPNPAKDIYAYVFTGPVPGPGEIAGDVSYDNDGYTVTATRSVIADPSFDLEAYKQAKIDQAKKQAYDMLVPTDYEVTKSAETGVAVPSAILTWRQSVRDATNDYEAALVDLETPGEVDAATVSWPEPL